MDQNNKSYLRKKIRSKRQQLSPEYQQNCSEQCLQTVLKSELIKNKQSIAFYISNDNELNLQPIIEYCLSHNKNCYLPVLNHQHLDFVKYDQYSEFKFNKYNIPEPVAKEHTDLIAVNNLDLVLLPLVAFNKTGKRLGMGGGFYDRTFAFINEAIQNSKRPLLYGVAYEFQCIDDIPSDPWDIKIDGILTEKEIINFNTL